MLYSIKGITWLECTMNSINITIIGKVMMVKIKLILKDSSNTSRVANWKTGSLFRVKVILDRFRNKISPLKNIRKL